jgi:hypothetical protein
MKRIDMGAMMFIPTKLHELMVIEGFESVDELTEECMFDSLVPGICMTKGCSFTAEVEQDCMEGWCEVCDKGTVNSCAILLGVI